MSTVSPEEDGCPHDNVVPFENGFGRCTVCGADDFPITNEAAGRLGCCGSYCEHTPGCDGVMRQDWALAAAAEKELEHIIRSLEFPIRRDFLRDRLEKVLLNVQRIRWDGADPPPRAVRERGFIGPTE